MNAVASLVLLFAFPVYPEPPMVEQTVAAVSVAHVADGAELLFFWDDVQGEWTCLDHRWFASDMRVGRDDEGHWSLTWLDYDGGVTSFRVVRTRCWIETWEHESPLAVDHGKPWFRRLLCPGLKQARAAQ